MRVRRRRARLWSAVFALCTIAFAFVILHYLSFMPRYNVQSIVVEGANRTSAAEVEGYALSRIHAGNNLFFSPSNIFLYHPLRLRKALLEHFPSLQSARINRPSLLSTSVHISVDERQPFALWCAPDHRCYVIDESGFIFDLVRGESAVGEPYVFTGGVSSATSTMPIGSTFASGYTPQLHELLQLFSSAGFAPEGARVENDKDFTVPLRNSFYLKASFGEDPQDLIKNLQLVLTSDALKDERERIEYIDLRFGDRVYYKLKET